MKNALDSVDAILAAGPPALFLDFDGTLAEIAPRPAFAVLPESVRDALRELSDHQVPVAVVSGRDLEDLRQRIGLPEVAYGGSHGFDLIAAPPACERYQPGAHLLPQLDGIDAELRRRVGQVPGIFMERKRFAFAVHYRQVAAAAVPRVAQEVNEALINWPGVQRREGKKVFELLPDVVWDKGRAVLWLLERVARGRTPIYVGDDISDEDAFTAIAGAGAGIVVQEQAAASAAGYRLRDPAEVERFLWAVAERVCR